jgi:hypothetical protein
MTKEKKISTEEEKTIDAKRFDEVTNPKKEEKRVITAEEIKETQAKLLEDISNAQKELNEILEKYNCLIDPMFIISSKGLSTKIQVINK